MSKRRYGKWAGNPEGYREDPTRCIEAIWEGGGWMRDRQCGRKRGKGPGGLYCGQHAKHALERERSRAQRERHD